MNLVNVLQIARIVFQLLPLIVEAMKEVENAMGQAPGGQKLEVVRTILQQAYATEQSVAVTFDQIWPALSAAIGSIKAGALFNGATAQPQPQHPAV